MRSTHLALLTLAGTIALSACGSPSAPTPAPGSLAAAPAVVDAPAPAAPKAPGKAAPAKTPVQTVPASAIEAVPAPAAPAAPTSANVAGGTSGGGGGGGTTTPAATTGTETGTGSGTGFQVAGGMGWGGTDFIVFASNRYPGEGNNDIYVFDPALDTVLAIVGVNTFDNEFNPRISDNGKWLVFQRTWGTGDCGCSYGYGNQDVLLYNMDMKLVNTLPGLNTEAFDEYMPDVSDDGCNIVYVTQVTAFPEVRLYNVKTGDNWAIPGANRNFADISWPTISANGLRIAYGASVLPGYGWAFDGTGNPTGGPAVTGNPLDFGESNVYVYDIPTGTQLTPPFVNTAFDEYNPDLCGDGTRMLYVSNRLGTEDIFEVNLDTGWTDNLSFLNTYLDEQHPRYLGGSVDRIVFQVTDSNFYGWGFGPGYGQVSLRAYNRATATLDTLPVANHILADSGLRAPQPETLP
jgi:hypothetical protein